MLPRTELLTAPSKLENQFGKGMHSRDLIKKLLYCKSTLFIPEPDSWGCHYPGKYFGMTSIWLEAPDYKEDYPRKARKICSFHLGMVPEFTQIGPEGGIIRKGWRGILDKMIKSKCVTKQKIERVFKVSLEYSNEEDPVCITCRKDGNIVPRDGKSQYCLSCRQTNEAVSLAREAREEGAYLVSRSA